MGGREAWQVSQPFAHLGVFSERPKIGSRTGAGDEHHYLWHIRKHGLAVAYANMSNVVAKDIFGRIDRGEVREERNRFALDLIKAKPRWCACNALYLWTPRGNPRDPKGTYLLPQTHEDAAVLLIYLRETDPKVWHEDRIGEPHFNSLV